jgi:hypothetical protein
MGYKKTDPFFSPLFSLGPAKKRGARVQGAGCPYESKESGDNKKRG